MKHKYIVLALADGDLIFVFPESIDHDRMAEACDRIRFGSERNWTRKLRAEGEVVSAGFINEKDECYGHSETLGLKSRGAVDTALLTGGASA